MNEPKTIDLRVHTEILKLPKGAKPARRKSGEPKVIDSGATLLEPPRWSRVVLVLDCETTTDQVQQLLFGSYQYCREKGREYVAVQEGIFYADDLDLQSLTILREYCDTNKLPLLSQSEFWRRIFWRAVRANAAIVGFNLPFDLSHSALEGTWTPRQGGAWSFTTGQYFNETASQVKEDTWNTPRIIIKPKDGKGAFFRSTRTRGSKVFPPVRCADLKTLIWALQSKSATLESACVDLYHVPGKLSGHTPTGRVTIEEIEYNRQDVRVSTGLLNAARADFDLHPIKLRPEKAFSPASIAKAYLDAMGIIPPLETFGIGPEMLGIAMQAYFGGRAECRIRHTPVPVVYTDFLSQYPTVNTLMDLWSILTAEELRVEDATDEVRDLLSQTTLDRALDPGYWTQLRFFALVSPESDVLPVRSDYNGETSNIGINPLTSAQPIWYAGPDLAGATLYKGTPPKIINAFKLVPMGQQAGLGPVKLRGLVEVDPRTDDFFKKVIEERARIKRADEHDPLAYFLKILANSGSYGLFVEVNPERLGNNPKTGKPARAKVKVYAGEETFETNSEFVEYPGRWYFPPIAALITAGGRLLLAALERAVSDKGGTYLMCDTDSMAIVASESGGLVPCNGGTHHLRDGRDAIKALSWTELLDRIVMRLDALNPYDRNSVSESILKIEKVNFSDGKQQELYGYGISAKRYALFSRTSEGIRIEKVSAHGIGYLFPPKRDFDKRLEVHVWIRDAWDYILRGVLQLPRTEPDWFKLPALMRFTVNTLEVLKALQMRQASLPYPKRVKPYSFGLLAITKQTKGVDPITPITAFTDDLSNVLKREWINMHDEKSCRLALPGEGLPGDVEVQTYGWIVGSYPWHPEAKSLAPDSKPCSELTAGLLKRTPVTAGDFQAIAKETDRRWEREEDISITEPHRLEYSRRKETPEIQTLRQKLEQFRAAHIHDESGVSIRTIKAIRNGHCNPKPRTIAALHKAINILEEKAYNAAHANARVTQPVNRTARFRSRTAVQGCSPALLSPAFR